METSDDPIVSVATEAALPILIGVGTSYAASAIAGKPDKPSRAIPSATAAKTDMPTKTAAPAPTLSEQARKNRRQASFMTRDFTEPKLGIPSLLGI
jgi:hypothetical protein